jgi:hypothetical protein
MGGDSPNDWQRRKGLVSMETLRITPPPPPPQKKIFPKGGSKDTTFYQIGGVTHGKSNLKVFNGQDTKGWGSNIRGQQKRKEKAGRSESLVLRDKEEVGFDCSPTRKDNTANYEPPHGEIFKSSNKEVDLVDLDVVMGKPLVWILTWKVLELPRSGELSSSLGSLPNGKRE